MPNDSNTTNGETKKNKPEETSSSQTSAADSKQLKDLQQQLATINLDGRPAPSNHQFWGTQPMPLADEVIAGGTNECIEMDKPLSEIKQDPYNLPPGFSWVTLDLLDSEHLDELYTLLNENYVEDDDNIFRFNYSREFLRWALMPPGWKRDWHTGVRISKTGKLFAFISAVPACVRVYDVVKNVVEINFLCVHKKLRSKRLAPVLIKEITRRVNLTGIFQAVYTAGVKMTHAVSVCTYWHRSLNPKKLIAVRFSYLAHNMTMQRTIRLYKLPEKPLTKGFRQLREGDVEQCCLMFTKHQQKYELCPHFDAEHFGHWFLPREGVIDSYVVENEGQITDFVSFYHLDSTVVKHPTYKDIKAAYSFYYFNTHTPLKTLMEDCLIAARNIGMDVFNALDLMENRSFMEALKFGQGDGDLRYYIYNWKCTSIPRNKLGLVLQ